jgi:tripartite-type tricarboxylate transporter receptor subunit TctC
VNLLNRTLARLVVAAGACAGLACPALAAYPDKPVRVIVPFAPGGNPDVLARILAQRLGQETGQAFVVENRPGSGGDIGAEHLTRSVADGYTLGVLDSAQTSINPALYRNVAFDVQRDLMPIAALVAVPTVLVVNPAVPANSAAELIRYARDHPGEINYGSAGNGSIHHLTTEIFATATGLRLTHVPYKGSTQTLPAIIGNQVQMAFVGVPAAKDLIESKRVRVLAISTARRSAALPDVPTLAESGVTGFDVAAVVGMFAPAGTPQDIVVRLRGLLDRAMSSPDVQSRLAGLGMAPTGYTPEVYATTIRTDLERYGKIVNESGMKLD